MGNAGSNTRDGYEAYGPSHAGNGHHYPYDPRLYGGDPYAYVNAQVNPLPMPPKEPLPQGPVYYPYLHHTPYSGPEHIRERDYEERGSSIGRKRGGGLVRSLTGLGKILGGGQKADHPSTPFTYPDGTPFPMKKLELSPLDRPQRFRRSSFSGMDRNAEREHAYHDYGDNRPPLASLSRWRTLNQSRKESEPAPERYKFFNVRGRDKERDKYFFPESITNGRTHRRRVSSETREPRQRGISFDDYVPPEKRDRIWTYPDGTPYPKPNEVLPMDEPVILPNSGASSNPLPPGPALSHPRGTTPLAASAGLPRPPSPHPHIFATPAARPQTQAPVQSNPAPVFPSNLPRPQSVHPLPPGIPEFLNPEKVFSFDRTNELCHFSYHGIVHNGKLYPSAYHLWEAMKFLETRPDLAKRIRKTPRTRDAMRLAQELGMADARPDWSSVSLTLLDDVLYIKCLQHGTVRDALLNTEHRKIVFLSQREPFWGWSTHGRKGDNQLGHSLERVRERLWNGGDPRPPLPAWRLEEGAHTV